MVVLSKDLQDDTGGKWERRFVRKMVFVLHLCEGEDRL